MHLKTEAVEAGISTLRSCPKRFWLKCCILDIREYFGSILRYIWSGFFSDFGLPGSRISSPVRRIALLILDADVESQPSAQTLPSLMRNRRWRADIGGRWKIMFTRLLWLFGYQSILGYLRNYLHVWFDDQPPYRVVKWITRSLFKNH